LIRREVFKIGSEILAALEKLRGLFALVKL
jgi:hypothetical protein